MPIKLEVRHSYMRQVLITCIRSVIHSLKSPGYNAGDPFYEAALKELERLKN